MTLDPDHTSSSRRILLLLLACVLALVLPFMVMRAVAPHPAASADAGTAALVGGGLATTPRQTTPGGAASTNSTSRTTSGTGASTRATTATTATTTTSSVPTASAPGAPLGADAEACRLANLRQQAPLSAACADHGLFRDDWYHQIKKALVRRGLIDHARVVSC